MNKQDLIDAVATETGLSKTAAADVITATLKAIGNTIAKGEQVQLIGFGSFGTGKRAARIGRNPQTGDEIKIAAATTVKFTAGKALKDQVNAVGKKPATK